MPRWIRPHWQGTENGCSTSGADRRKTLPALLSQPAIVPRDTSPETELWEENATAPSADQNFVPSLSLEAPWDYWPAAGSSMSFNGRSPGHFEPAAACPAARR